MKKEATNVDEQIALLRQRGMMIIDEEKAKEVLLDIGYYRLGFYWFPFEQSYPSRINRTHIFRPGTTFEDIVKLYYFDFNLRGILSKYLNRIEIHLRTFLTYHVSNKHVSSPTWFVNPAVVSVDYIHEFGKTVYTSTFRRTLAIKHHHKMHINDIYAPAWKTIEFMTLGGIIHLFDAIKDQQTKREISEHFGIKHLPVFESYLTLIRTIRNACAHGSVLYDIALPTSIRKGPAGAMAESNYQRLHGAIRVILYMIGVVSVNRQQDLKVELEDLFKGTSSSPVVYETIRKASGIERISDLFV